MSFMQETPRSLRAYFIVAGALGLWTSVSLAAVPGGPLEVAQSVFAAAFGLAFIVAGAVLPRALRDGTNWILKLLIANGAYAVVRMGFLLLAGHGSAGIFGVVVALAITAYLYANVLRLEREARPVERIFE